MNGNLMLYIKFNQISYKYNLIGKEMYFLLTSLSHVIEILKIPIFHKIGLNFSQEIEKKINFWQAPFKNPHVIFWINFRINFFKLTKTFLFISGTYWKRVYKKHSICRTVKKNRNNLEVCQIFIKKRIHSIIKPTMVISKRLE